MFGLQKNGITIYILHQNSKDSQTNYISGRISFSNNQFFLRPANGIFCLKCSTTHIDLSLWLLIVSFECISGIPSHIFKM